jgi:hypothetical protein
VDAARWEDFAFLYRDLAVTAHTRSFVFSQLLNIAADAPAGVAPTTDMGAKP